MYTKIYRSYYVLNVYKQQQQQHALLSKAIHPPCAFYVIIFFFLFFFFFFFHWHYSPPWALACRTMSFQSFLSATNSLHFLTPSTLTSLSTSSFHLFLGHPLLLVPYSTWVKNFLGILSSSILSRWPNQLILCPFIHFTIFSPLLISSSSRFPYNQKYNIFSLSTIYLSYNISYMFRPLSIYRVHIYIYLYINIYI